MRHAIKPHIIAQEVVKGGGVKQNFPFGAAAAVAGGGTDAVHAFGTVGVLAEMVQAGVVFLAKGDLFFVLQHGKDVALAGFVIVLTGQPSECALVFVLHKGLGLWVGEVFEWAVWVVGHGADFGSKGQKAT